MSESELASPAWRLQNLYTIKPKQGDPVKFKPNWAQREFYNNQWYCNHILKARQLGLSTFISVQNLDAMLFNEFTTCGIVDHTMDDAKKKLAMVRLAYERLDDARIHPDTWRLGEIVKAAVKMDANKEEIVFSNGSSIYCSTSLRGGTVQRLHISELGKTAFSTPLKAEEIKAGSLNTVAPGQVINIESTHEGGKAGLHYELLLAAMKLVGQELTEIDFAFHFFPWWRDPSYRLDREDLTIRPEILRYFEVLRKENGIVCDHGQMLWYDRKEPSQGYAMFKEFPSTPGEAVNALVEGSIYGTQMADLRSKGRICGFEPDPTAPLFTCWDIGGADATAIWLVQPTRREFLWLNWYENNREDAAHYADVVREWEGVYGRKIAGHFLPHDAKSRERLNKQSPLSLLQEAGLGNLMVVPRTADVWVGINRLRGMLPSCWFHSACDRETARDGRARPSGVNCLASYHTKKTDMGVSVREHPVHDESSHSCDAARTFAEAWALGLVDGSVESRPGRPVNRTR